ncbi:MAG: hypothetical protein DCF12_04245 [Snowella sp.]|nr:MAG: hypothetical protein DCF12_04245 [Snowella sp.]
MKRNLNLIRKILLDIENAPPGKVISASNFNYEEFEELIIVEHLKLLVDAKLLEGNVIEDSLFDGSIVSACFIHRLTWDGHEFLANAKNDTIWKKVTSQAEEKGESISIFVLNQLLASATKKYLGLD